MLQLIFMNVRLVAATVCYGLLALFAGFTLEGMFRLAVWVFIGGLAIKTWIAALANR